MPFTDIIIILVLIALNGIFAMSEFAIVSAKKIRLRQKAEKGDAGAETAFKLSNEPTAFLSTVQIGITLVGIFAGAFGGEPRSQENLILTSGTFRLLLDTVPLSALLL